MDDPTSFQVEAPLIDAYPGVTNIAGGVGSAAFGAMHAREIVQRYAAEPAVFRHRALLINVNRSAKKASLYEATSCAWRIDPRKAKRAEVVLPTRQGLIVGAFVVSEWLPATTENFPGRETLHGRFGFVGKDADNAIRDMYVGKRVPDDYRELASANPVRYTY